MGSMSKTDRYIILGAIGILLVSACITFEKLLQQHLRKEKIKISQQENLRLETLNIKIWRRYHEAQMVLMHEILTELGYQNNNPTLTRQDQNP